MADQVYQQTLAPIVVGTPAARAFSETVAPIVIGTPAAEALQQTLAPVTIGTPAAEVFALWVCPVVLIGSPVELQLPSGLWQSDVIFDQNFSGFIENGQRLNWVYQPVLLPDTELMANNAMVETTLAMAFIGANPTVSITFSDAEDGLLDAVSIAPNTADTDWNAFDWNEAPWNGGVSSISPWSLQWTVPLVFKQGLFVASGASYTGFKIGNIFMKYQPLGYLQQFKSGSS